MNVDKFQIDALIGYSNSIYNNLMNLYNQELISVNYTSYKKKFQNLVTSIKGEKNIYAKLTQKELKDLYYYFVLEKDYDNTLYESINLIINNNKESLINKRIINKLYSLLNDEELKNKEDSLREILVEDTIRLFIYLLNNNEYKIMFRDFLTNFKYSLAFLYDKIMSFLIENKFTISKDLIYWYSYFYKDVNHISNINFYDYRNEFVSKEFQQFKSSYEFKRVVINYLLTRALTIMVPEKFSDEELLEVLKYRFQNDELYSKSIEYFKQDIEIPKLIRLGNRK